MKLLGGGRLTKEQEIDLSVGLDMKKKNGDRVSKGECICEIYSRNKAEAETASEQYLRSVAIEDNAAGHGTLIYTLDE